MGLLLQTRQKRVMADRAGAGTAAIARSGAAHGRGTSLRPDHLVNPNLLILK